MCGKYDNYRVEVIRLQHLAATQWQANTNIVSHDSSLQELVLKAIREV